MDPRPLPVKTFEYSSFIPSSLTSINSRTTYITSMILSNVDTNNHTVTLKDASGATRSSIAVASQDTYTREFPNGWDFVNGISIQCDAPSVVQVEFFGYQNYL